MVAVVPGENDAHTLEELVAFYLRTPFLIWMGFLSSFLIVLLLYAHITEWKFECRVARLSAIREASENVGLTGMVSPKRGSILWSRKRRSSISITSGKALGMDGAALTSAETNENSAIGATVTSSCRYGAIDHSTSLVSPIEQHDSDDPSKSSSSPLLGKRFAKTQSVPFTPTPEELERTKLILGIAYGSISGTLSGLCLLFAKTGIELLILTVLGKNQVSQTCQRPLWRLLTLSRQQFGRIEAWLIVLVLLFAALLQVSLAFLFLRFLRLTHVDHAAVLPRSVSTTFPRSSLDSYITINGPSCRICSSDSLD